MGKLENDFNELNKKYIKCMNDNSKLITKIYNLNKKYDKLKIMYEDCNEEIDSLNNSFEYSAMQRIQLEIDIQNTLIKIEEKEKIIKFEKLKNENLTFELNELKLNNNGN